MAVSCAKGFFLFDDSKSYESMKTISCPTRGHPSGKICLSTIPAIDQLRIPPSQTRAMSQDDLFNPELLASESPRTLLCESPRLKVRPGSSKDPTIDKLGESSSCHNTYYTIVIEDIESGDVVGSGTVLHERKFIHECGSVSVDYFQSLVLCLW